MTAFPLRSGMTNAWHVAARTELGATYNDVSCNENRHASVGFASVVRAGLLASLSPGEYALLRKGFVAAILATDSAWKIDNCAYTTARVCRPNTKGLSPCQSHLKSKVLTIAASFSGGAQVPAVPCRGALLRRRRRPPRALARLR